ncbi:CFEM domain-containing protein [Mycena chlorophos]|uniref:CFEM domain-containing protein n=1 Tax=Mycena chlorophos TaxID=658473 RepID=A0A8H6TH07_MYCCL|nr:CFEM domain-containing protein [Mycena chlorophos]
MRSFPLLAALVLVASASASLSLAVRLSPAQGNIVLAGLPPNLSPCLESCIAQAAANSACKDPMDVSCVCTNQAFQQAAGTCLEAHCTSDDLMQAVALQQQECAGQSGTATETHPSSTSKTTHGTSSVSAHPASSATTTTVSISTQAGNASDSAHSAAYSSAYAQAGGSVAATASASASSASASAEASARAEANAANRVIVARSKVGVVVGVMLAGVVLL